MSAEITNVIADSPAWHHGVKAGDILVSVNGHKISDVLDYMYYSSESMVTLALKRISTLFSNSRRTNMTIWGLNLKRS